MENSLYSCNRRYEIESHRIQKKKKKNSVGVRESLNSSRCHNSISKPWDMRK